MLVAKKTSPIKVRAAIKRKSGAGPKEKHAGLIVGRGKLATFADNQCGGLSSLSRQTIASWVT